MSMDTQTCMLLAVIFCVSSAFLLDRDTTEAPITKQPHVVFVLADDYGYNDIGYHNPLIKTPNLDSIAASGVKLENYYVQPICSPTRSQLMSGRYQIHTGMQHGVIRNNQPRGLPLDSPTIADKLKEAGYSTHMVGKWHLGFYKEEYTPWKRGFDSYLGYLGGMEDYYNHTTNYKGTPILDFYDGPTPTRQFTGQYSTTVFTDRATSIIDKHNSSRPFFLYLAYQAVHDPLEAPESFKRKYSSFNDENRKTYAGMVTAMDEGIGKVVKALKRNAMWKDTIFVFSSDNGGFDRSGGNNYPLRGQKTELWEGGIKAVGFVKGPGVKPRVSQELMHVTDWFPTLISVSGGSLNGTKPLDGYNQWQTISQGKSSKRKVILHNIDPLGRTKGVRRYNDTFDTTVRAGLRYGDFKLLTGNPGFGKHTIAPEQISLVTPIPPILEGSDKNVWLFNITADPSEQHDLSELMPAKVKEMLTLLAAFNETSVPVFSPKADRKYNPVKHAVWGPWQ